MGYESPSLARKKVLDLGAKRDAMEEEMDSIVASLTVNNGPGVTGNLVDKEGFPRADIDIPTIRAKRQRLAILKTDYEAILKEIDYYMQIALAPSTREETIDTASESQNKNISSTEIETDEVTTETMPTNPRDTATEVRVAPRPSFAKVDQVSEGSPAATANIQLNDEIIAFGAVSLRNFGTPNDAMAALPGLLREHAGREIVLVVKRDGNVINLSLVPREWGGRGLLGCHVVPMQVSQTDEIYAPEVATAVKERTASNNYHP